MKKVEKFNYGMGIGGWLTNYKRFNVLPNDKRMDLTVGDFEHFESFITEADVKNIADMGFDHIRLGFDQIVLEERPFVYRERIFSLLDKFVSYCEKHGLGLVLNLHKAIGNYCDISEPVSIFESDELMDRFVALWLEIEKRYNKNGDVMFELLNEVRDINPDDWNNLAEKAIKEIRKINPIRRIIVGSTRWNNVETLKYLRIWDDENVFYTFHMYEPFEFTHQRGVLKANTLYYNRKLEYPCDDVDRYRDFYRLNGENRYENLDRIDINYIRSFMKGAKEFTEAHPDKVLWCGEFGTIRHADIKSRENWMRDVITVLKEWNIPYCVWNYLSTPNDGNRFSLVDDDIRKILSKGLLNALLGK